MKQTDNAKPSLQHMQRASAHNQPNSKRDHRPPILTRAALSLPLMGAQWALSRFAPAGTLAHIALLSCARPMRVGSKALEL